MPITSLGIDGTKINDLSPLKGMSQSTPTWCSTKTQVTDLSPLRGMPLTTLRLRALRET